MTLIKARTASSKFLRSFTRGYLACARRSVSFTRSSINCPHKLHTPACGRPSLVLLGQMSLRATAANCSTVVKRLVEAPRPSLARGSKAGPASGGGEKNQEAACLCTRLATRERNLFLLKTRELRPPAWPLAQRPAKQPARPLGKANEKSVFDFYLSNKVRRTGEPAGSPRAPRTAFRCLQMIDVC